MSAKPELSFNQLATLIGAFAFPDPDGDDSIMHGPGGPRVRGVLAEIRRVTVAVIEWAEKLGEQAMMSAGEQPRPESKGINTSGATASDGTKSKTDDKCSKDNCDGQDPSSVKGTQPPGVAMVIIEPSIHHFAHDLANHDTVHLPIPAGNGANPWTLAIGRESSRSSVLLVVAAMFQFASEATLLGRLRELFAKTAEALFGQGLAHLGESR